MVPAETLDHVVKIYGGSDGAATKRLYEQLAAIGPIGDVAVNLFRAQKCSARAKVYRRGYSRDAYERKEWSIGLLCTSLDTCADALGIVWGWGIDEKAPVYRHVLYVELEPGQVSFHTGVRGAGPDYLGGWDEQPGTSPERICRFVASVLAGQR